MPASRPSPGRRALATLVVALSGLVLPVAAQGATYQVQACNSASSYAVDGVVGSYIGGHSYYFAACDSASRFLGGSFNPTIEHTSGDMGHATFSAPSGTSLASISGVRDAAAGPSRAYGTPVARLFTELARARGIRGGRRLPAVRQRSDLRRLNGASAVSWGVLCAGNAGLPGR